VLFANLPVGTLGVDEPLYISAGWEYVHGEADRNREHPYLAKQIIGLSQTVFGRTLHGARLGGSLLAGLTRARRLRRRASHGRPVDRAPGSSTVLLLPHAPARTSSGSIASPRSTAR
jgi:hypothetical protein